MVRTFPSLWRDTRTSAECLRIRCQSVAGDLARPRRPTRSRHSRLASKGIGAKDKVRIPLIPAGDRRHSHRRNTANMLMRSCFLRSCRSAVSVALRRETPPESRYRYYNTSDWPRPGYDVCHAHLARAIEAPRCSSAFTDEGGEGVELLDAGRCAARSSAAPPECTMVTVRALPLSATVQTFVQLIFALPPVLFSLAGIHTHPCSQPASRRCR
ncbi:hypothetical protein FB451DRAFT_572368 [Mycena latifolia]|nr:hypothetical protein FB451DRAFT_572368 [Mycena latifolia]